MSGTYYSIEKDLLTGVANTIRSKIGSSSQLYLSQFPSNIQQISATKKMRVTYEDGTDSHLFQIKPSVSDVFVSIYVYYGYTQPPTHGESFYHEGNGVIDIGKHLENYIYTNIQIMVVLRKSGYYDKKVYAKYVVGDSNYATGFYGIVEDADGVLYADYSGYPLINFSGNANGAIALSSLNEDSSYTLRIGKGGESLVSEKMGLTDTCLYEFRDDYSGILYAAIGFGGEIYVNEQFITPEMSCSIEANYARVFAIDESARISVSLNAQGVATISKTDGTEVSQNKIYIFIVRNDGTTISATMKKIGSSNYITHDFGSLLCGNGETVYCQVNATIDGTEYTYKSTEVLF